MHLPLHHLRICVERLFPFRLGPPHLGFVWQQPWNGTDYAGTEISVGVVAYTGWLSPNRVGSAVLFHRWKVTRCNDRVTFLIGILPNAIIPFRDSHGKGWLKLGKFGLLVVAETLR
jgi:hypothetical protein